MMPLPMERTKEPRSTMGRLRRGAVTMMPAMART